MRFIYHIIIGICVALLARTANAQILSFRHLTVAEGMPSNATGHHCFDSSGIAWISTNDGLVSFDGVSITQYLRSAHPGLPRNEPGFLSCDSRNRIWICTNNGLAVLNEKRIIETVIIHDSLKGTNIDYCFEIKGLGIIAVGRQTYLQKEGQPNWEIFHWFDNNIRKGQSITEPRFFNSHSYLFIMHDRLLLVDFVQQKIITDVVLHNIQAACRLNERELVAVCDSSWGFYTIDIQKAIITDQHAGVKDQHGQPILSPCYDVSVAVDGNVYIASRSQGIILFNTTTGRFHSYRHDPLNSQSLSNNFPRWIHCNASGYLMASSSAGVNYTNVLNTSFQQQSYFKDRQGQLYDGTIIGVAEDNKGQLWISNYAGIFAWNDSSYFIEPIWKNTHEQLGMRGFFEPGRIGIDNKGQPWIPVSGDGIHVYSGDGKLLRKISAKTGDIPSTEGIRLIKPWNEQYMIMGSEKGLYFINRSTFRAEQLPGHPLLQQLSTSRIVDILADDHQLWIASSPNGGAWCYDLEKKTLKKWTTKEGLNSDRVYCLAKDNEGTVYVGTYEGLNVINRDGSITVYNRSNGLRHSRVENLVFDKNGFLWITNFNSLIRFDPRNASFNYFDSRNGVGGTGFQVASHCTRTDGSIVFASSDGLLLVNPFQLISQPRLAPVIIHRLYPGNGYELVNNRQTIRLPYRDADIDFYFLSPDLVSGNRYFYRYRMEGYDTGWSAPARNHRVSYRLQPGSYVFHAQVSYNGNDWVENDNGISIEVPPPYWQTWWFRSLLALVVAVLIWWLMRRRIARIKTKSAIRQQLAELEAKALRAQMNPHFIFNSLNAIQRLIVVQDMEGSYHYLSKFSKLLRMVLDNSERPLIVLNDELEMNVLYLELESLRFKKSFEYAIQVSPDIEADTLLIPSLLLQPFLENAIWHGLMHKEGYKKLSVVFTKENDQLHCVIEDNGIGRERSAAIKEQKIGAMHFESKGTKLSEQRIRLLNTSGNPAELGYTDLYNDAGEVAGTRVTIRIPLQKKKLS